MLRAEFQVAFDQAILALANAEGATKQQMRELSRELLIAIHGFKDANLNGDIQFINKTLTVLTPANRRFAVEFFEHFAGFHYDKLAGSFTKKSSKRYAKAKEDAAKWLEDPHNNFWSWLKKTGRDAPKAFSTEHVTKFMTNAIKKAAGVNLTHADLLRAVFHAGFTPENIIQVMDEITADYEARKANGVKADDKAPEPTPF